VEVRSPAAAAAVGSGTCLPFKGHAVE